MRGRRMYLTLTLIGASIAFLTYMQSAPPGMFPAWVSFICGGLGLFLTIVAGGLKREDNRITKARAHPVPRVVDHAAGMRQPRPGERGFTVMQFLGAMLLGSGLIVLGSWCAGCSALPLQPTDQPRQVCAVDEPDPFRAELERWAGAWLAERQVPMPCLVAHMIAHDLLDRAIVIARAKADPDAAAPLPVP